MIVLDSDKPVVMNRNTETNSLSKKEQSYNKRNSSSGVELTINNRSNSKIPTEKPFNVNGKDIYVIDPPADSDNPEIKIISAGGARYEDRSEFLRRSGPWPACSGDQFEMLNAVSKCDESLGSGGATTNAKRASPRSKSLNPLDHINQDNRNANRNNPPPPTSATQNKYELRQRRECLFIFFLYFL